MLRACDRSREAAEYGELSDDEKKKIDDAVRHLEDTIKTEDHEATRDAIEALNEATMRLAELVMTAAIGKALKNKRVKEIQ